MTRKEDKIIFDMLSQIRSDVRHNNKMLQDICEVINMYLANYSRENEEDFGRNVLANLISDGIDLRELFRKR